jgi:hypothetical protein
MKYKLLLNLVCAGLVINASAADTKTAPKDAVYAVPGFVSIPVRGNSSGYVGTAFDANLNWQIQRHISFQASYVHFLTGDYVKQAGGKDVNYFSTTITFLF